MAGSPRHSLLRNLTIISAVTLLSLCACIFFVEYSHIVRTEESAPSIIAFLVLLLASYCLPAATLIISLTLAFRRHHRSVLLFTIVFGYLGLVFSFAGLYYAMAALGDHNDAVDAYYYYKYGEISLLSSAARQPGSEELLRRGTSVRAFKGISAKLWRGVEDAPGARSRGYEADAARNPVIDITMAARRPLEEATFFDYSARTSVFLDCFHFSVVTIATLGYGDVTPNLWYSKLAADVEVLSGIVLLVIGLGMLFSRWWEEPAEGNAGPGV